MLVEPGKSTEEIIARQTSFVLKVITNINVSLCAENHNILHFDFKTTSIIHVQFYKPLDILWSYMTVHL